MKIRNSFIAASRPQILWLCRCISDDSTIAAYVTREHGKRIDRADVARIRASIYVPKVRVEPADASSSLSPAEREQASCVVHHSRALLKAQLAYGQHTLPNGLARARWAALHADRAS